MAIAFWGRQSNSDLCRSGAMACSGSSGDGNLGEVSSTDAKLVLLETDSASSSSSNLSLSQEDTVDESGVVPPADGAPGLFVCPHRPSP